MKKKLTNNSSLITVMLLGFLVLGSVAAFAGNGAGISMVFGRPQVNINLAGTVTRDNNNVPVEKVGEVKPGEVLHWTINSENNGDGNANEYKTIGKIPTGTSFVEGSAKSDGAPVMTYSIDGGKTFVKQPMIDEKQADGSVKSVPAPASMFTHVRFEWGSALTPSEKLNASYDVVVK